MIGVNVSISDIAGLGAITDLNGKYSIKMPPYHKLVFTYIGFEKVEVLVKEQTYCQCHDERSKCKRN